MIRDPHENPEMEWPLLPGGLPPRRPQEASPPPAEPAAARFIPVPSLMATPLGITFPCPQCRTSLTTHGGELSGLCPVCGNLIAELPKPPLPLVPLPPVAVAGAAVPHIAAPPTPAPAVETSDSAGQDEALSPRRPDANRLRRSGNISHRVLGPEDIPDRSLSFEMAHQDVPPTTADSSTNDRQKISGAKWVGVAVAVVVFLGLVTAFATLSQRKRGGMQDQPAAVAPPPVEELRGKLREGAMTVFNEILGSGDPAVIAARVVGGEEMIPSIQERLKGGIPFPRLSEENLVTEITMNEADIRSGFFSFHYQAAPDDTLSLDSPLLAADAAQGVTGLSLLEGGAVLQSRSKPPPRQAMAIFATRAGRQLLEWELFIQTWDRTLISFIDGELGNGPLRFRVVLSLDKPVFENGELVDQTIVRMQDPLHHQDIVRVSINPYDPAVAALGLKASGLAADRLTAMRPQTATVDLVRSAETGRVEIAHFVCKEFLGLGGRENDFGGDQD